MSSQKKFLYYSLVLLLPLGLVWFFARSCFLSEAEGQLCVGWLDTYIQPIRYVTGKLSVHPKYYYNMVLPYFFGFAVVMALLSLVRKQVRPALFWLLTTLPILGEWSSLVGEATNTIIFYVAGGVVLAIFWFCSRRVDDFEDSPGSLHYGEILLFMLLIFCVGCARFFALNRIPAGWDAEICVYRLYSSSFDRLWQHESGWSPQCSTGLSWLLLNRFVGHFDEPNIYYLYHRTLGCLISIVKVSVLFLFLRTFFGRFAAFFGCAIVAFGPPDDWWSRVPNYHHWPGIMTILVIWATIHAMQKKTWTSFIFLSLLSFTTRWLYPSAMFMVAVPLTFFASLLVFQWSQWKAHFWKISVLLIGVAMWSEWFSTCRALYLGRWEWLPPVNVPSHSHISGTIFDKLHRIFIEHGADLFTELFYKQVDPTHWTVAMTPEPWKIMPSVVAVLSVLAIARMIGERRDKIGWLLVICLFFGAVPGLASSMADRRIGSMYVVLLILAAREAAWLAHFMERSTGRFVVNSLRVVSPIAIGAYLAVLSAAFLFFTTRGIPRQTAIGKVLQQNVRDNYLLVDLTGQLNCDLFLSVYRQLRNSNCQSAFVSSNFNGEFTAQSLIENPRFDSKQWWYAEKGVTDLGMCADWPTRKWAGVTFIITESGQAEQWIEQLKQRFPNGRTEEVKVSYIPYHEEKVIVFTTLL